MHDQIENFLTALRAANASPNTIRAYRFDLGELEQSIKSIEDLNRESLRAFASGLAKQNFAPTSRRRKLAVVQSFTLWLLKESLISGEVNFAATRLVKPKLFQTLPVVPSVQEMALLLDGDFPTAFPERDRLILELLYGCGLRVTEAARISGTDLHTEKRLILIHGKGGKDRLVPFGIPAARALGDYIRVRAEKLKDIRLKTEYLFFGVKNSVNGITGRSVGRMLATICKLRGLPRLHPHLLRHACATHMMDNGAPIELIARILGHSNLETSALYARVSTRLMSQAYSTAHPHAGIREKAFNGCATISTVLHDIPRKIAGSVAEFLMPKKTEEA
jgi:integrase/recombinase XerC